MIKTFEQHSNFERVSENIKDIFLELKDKYPNLIIESNEISGGPNNLSITIRPDQQYYSWSYASGYLKVITTIEIKDELVRLKNYLESEGYKFYTFNYAGYVGSSNTTRFGTLKYASENFKGRRHKSDLIFEYLFKINPTTYLELFFR